MSSHHNNGNGNAPSDGGLDKITRAYRQMNPEEPPDLLDQAILNRAHRAVEKQPHWTQFGWLHGLTTAAVVVLAFSIVFNQRDSAPQLESGLAPVEFMEYSTQELPGEKAELRVSELRKEIKRDEWSLDEDVQADQAASEEVLFKITDTVPEEPRSGAAPTQNAPATVAEPVMRAARESSPAEPDPEQELQEIIRLKLAGDESWLEELEQFKKRYPDYPLPDGLKD